MASPVVSNFSWDVFLSHSSTDKAIVEQAAERLKKAELRVWFDADMIEVGDSIPTEIEKGLKGSMRLVVFMSPAAMESEWVKRERDATYFLDRGGVERPIIPVLLQDCDIRPLLKPIKHLDLRTPNEAAWQKLLKACGLLPTALPATRKIQLDHLPTTSGKLFGREGRLQELDLAWEIPTRNILVLVADGGVGKTGLVVEWLNRMQQKNYAWAEWVFGWSFYSQGTSEDRQVSSEPFFQEAFQFFGKSADDYKDPRAKGRRLAELVGERRGLLVLDGLEPLQYPPVVAHLGGLRDAGMAAFLKTLAWNNAGLCVVTSRVPVHELQGITAARHMDLERLTPEAGAELLASYTLQATQKELEKAAKKYDGHALALNLLGSYLVAAHGGDICRQDKILALNKERKQGAHAKRVMASYERWLDNKPELAMLYLTGLFDRPATAEEIRAVLGESPIVGLTDCLPEFDSEEWQNAVGDLRDLHLLAPTTQSQIDALDCHPLVREYFGGQLKTLHPDAWQEAHRRLFEYFRTIPDKEQPDTLEDLLPLYRAIPHGCQAGLHQQALDEVYKQRISRGKEAYAIKKLGAFGLELGAVAAFFDQPWSRPAAGLSASAQSFVLNLAAFCLRAMGRLQETLPAYEVELAMRIQQQSWKNAAITASNLSESNLTCADLPRAIAFAQLAVAVIDTTDDAFRQIAYRTTHADALHQAGEWENAITLFQEAETRQKTEQPASPILYSLQGYQYHDLLLAQKQYQFVLQRATTTLQWVTKARDLLSIALDQLTLGQAHAGLLAWQEAEKWLDKAVASLEGAGQQQYIPSGLIARAGFYRMRQRWAQARQDLDEAWEISQRGGMKFFFVQLHLEESQLALAQGGTEKATEQLDKAETLIQETGLFRFAEQADTLRRQLGGTLRTWDKKPLAAATERAKKEIFKKYPPPTP